jgi:hypothetical protein
MFARSERLSDWTRNQTQEIEGISPHVSGTSSNQSAQLGHLSHLESHYRSRSQRWWLSRENVGASTSHSPMGPHGLLEEYRYFILHQLSAVTDGLTDRQS